MKKIREMPSEADWVFALAENAGHTSLNVEKNKVISLLQDDMKTIRRPGDDITMGFLGGENPTLLLLGLEISDEEC